jgi:hypothetical protein
MFKAPSDASAVPADVLQQRKRSNSFSNYFRGQGNDTTTSTSNLTEAERQLRAQRQQLLEQARTTASAVASASGGGEEHANSGGVGGATGMIDAETEHKLREQAIEVARRSLLAEQQQLALKQNHGSPRRHQLGASALHGGASVTVDTTFDLMDDDLVSPREMTSEDITQLVLNAAAPSQQSLSQASLAPSARTAKAAAGAALPTPSAAAAAARYERLDRQEQSVVPGGTAADDALRRRHTRVFKALQQLRATAASGTRTPEHIAVLEKHGFATAPALPTLCHVEAKARMAAHAHLAQHLNGGASMVAACGSPDAMLITF